MSTVKQCMYLAITMLPACSTIYGDTQYNDEQRNRIILESATRQPIHGVITAFEWERTDADIGATRTYCVHAEIAISDQSGRYSVPTWRGLSPMIMAHYKVGMTDARERQSYERGIDLIKPFEGTTRQRFEQLGRILNSLNCPEDDIRRMKSLFVTINEEAQSLVRSDEDLRMAEMFQIEADSAVYGSDEAQRRYLARMTERNKGNGK